MNAQEFFFRNTKRFFKEFGPGHHIAGLIVLAVVAFGSLQFFHPGSNTAAFDFAQQQQSDNAPAPVEYFPAQFVNQATQPERQTETF